MSDFRPPRGMSDLLPQAARAHRDVSEKARSLSALYGFEEIITPLIEFETTFKRTLGDTSDIVSKEMFYLESRGEEKLILRPEATASVMRALMAEKLTQTLPLKYFYAGPMFRYDRPQKGRYRQFHQIGVESIGVDSPKGDLEVLLLAVNLLKKLKLFSKTTLEINSLGTAESRVRYRDALVEYFKAYQEKLSAESLARLAKNPMRILDSKEPEDKEIVKNAPFIADFFDEISKDFFKQVSEGLESFGIPFQINPRLVRGLDYYCHTTFEFVTTELGAQGTVLAGGRYDSLATLMGSSTPLPSVGWAAGVERLVLLMDSLVQTQRPLAFAPIGEEASKVAYQWVESLRTKGYKVEILHKENLKARMKHANRIQASHVLILGEEELKAEKVCFKNLDSGEETLIFLKEMEDKLKEAGIAPQEG